jgi:CCR4-NOT transcription complex subunit 1
MGPSLPLLYLNTNTRQLVDSHGMEVFSKYFRRVLQNNAAHVFGTGARSAETNGSYQILVAEMQKLRKEAEQADKIAESLSSSEGDLFVDFDLSTFVSHFKLDPLAKGMLALACRRTDLRQKGTRNSDTTCTAC